jgi:hypothetical protein
MFYSINQFPFLESIRSRVDEIAVEFNEAKKELPQLSEFMLSRKPELYSHTDYWTKETGITEDKIGYDARNGTWGAFPIFKEGFPIKWYSVNDFFPTTIKLIESVPDVYFSSFMRLSPGSKAAPHQHQLSHLIFHLALFDNKIGSSLTCGDSTIHFRNKGDYAIFDYRNIHSSENYGLEERIHLTIDFRCKIERSELILI